MTVGGDVLLRFFSAVAVFFIVHQGVRKLIESCLYGRLNGIYLKYVYRIFSKRASHAFKKEDERAWDKVADAKLEELGAHRYEKRKQALDYLEHVQPTKKLAAKLVGVLPHQHRHPHLQARVACFLCRTLEALNQKKTDDKNVRSESSPEKMLRAWGMSLAVWIADAVWFWLLWGILDQLPISVVGPIALIVFVLAFLPLLTVITGCISRVIAASVVMAIVSACFWFFADTMHTETSCLEQSLCSHDDDWVVSIQHPQWLTADDVDPGKDPERHGGHVVVNVTEGTLTYFSLHYDSRLIRIRGTDGNLYTLPISQTQPIKTPFEFFLQVTDKAAFSDATADPGATTFITPVLKSDSLAHAVSVDELALSIKLEPPAWRVFRDVFRAISGTGGSAGAIGTLLLWLYQYIREQKRES